jgi:hypothetical protein
LSKVRKEDDCGHVENVKRGLCLQWICWERPQEDKYGIAAHEHAPACSVIEEFKWFVLRKIARQYRANYVGRSCNHIHLRQCLFWKFQLEN